MKRYITYSASAVALSLVISGCVGKQVVVANNDSTYSKPGTQRLSTILERIKNKNQNEKYSLATSDIAFDFAEADKISSFLELTIFLEKKGYVYEIVANKYRIDLPKIITVVEKGRYAGNLSTVPFQPFYQKALSEVLMDLGVQTKYLINMDEDVVFESKKLQPPSALFRGQTVSDFLAFVESTYDYHVGIDQRSAVVSVSKYKSKVFDVIADKNRIKADAFVFLSGDIDSKKAKDYVADNGKLFVTGTPSVFDKVQRYADEVNANSADKAIFSFDGKTSIFGLLSTVNKNIGITAKITGTDFIPAKDIGVWFEKVEDIDKYVRKNFNKKIIKTSELDVDRNGVSDFATYEVKDVRGVSLSSPNTITSFFKKLSAINGREYIVDGDGNIPISSIEVDSFEVLKEFLYSSAGIIIEKTDPGNGLPVIVRVK